MEITMIGTGNVATVLGLRFTAAGHTISELYGRNAQTTKALATKLRAVPVTDFAQLTPHTGIFLLAVPDDAIAGVSQLVTAQRAIIAHTAGSVSKHILQQGNRRYGVFYPLQTLSVSGVTTQEIPLLIDGSDDATAATLMELGRSISPHCALMGDAERKKVHLAAVMTNNFINHLTGLVQEYCRKEGVDFNLLLPLFRETTSRAESYSMLTMQTGPAARNDNHTIEAHERMLEGNSALLKIYRTFTDSIKKSSGH